MGFGVRKDASVKARVPEVEEKQQRTRITDKPLLNSANGSGRFLGESHLSHCSSSVFPLQNTYRGPCHYDSQNDRTCLNLKASAY
jgi:hypothetical protein